MCTVTYIPPSNEQGFILTSNRDERAQRPTLPPRKIIVNSQELFFPQDVEAGGSWIAANKNGKSCVLLNGAYFAHKKLAIHTVSRGKILIDFTASDHTVTEYFKTVDLKNTEPFTIICVQLYNSKILHFDEFVWDGYQKHYSTLNPSSAYIWSSATLYNKLQRQERVDWFNAFLKRGDLRSKRVLEFHQSKHTDNPSLNIIVSREGNLKTVSTTQIIQDGNTIHFDYYDLLEQKNHFLQI